MNPEEIYPDVVKVANYEMKPGMSKTHESPATVSHPYVLPEDNSAEASQSGVDSDWAQRVNELGGKLRKIHREKVEAQEQRVEAVEKLQKQLEEEKQKSEEITKKAFEDLHREAEKQEVLTRGRVAFQSRGFG